MPDGDPHTLRKGMGDLALSGDSGRLGALQILRLLRNDAGCQTETLVSLGSVQVNRHCKLREPGGDSGGPGSTAECQTGTLAAIRPT